MQLERQLKELGLTENEIKVYLTLLRIGTAQAGRIAVEAALERTSTYNALKRLQEKSIIASVVEGKTRMFSAGLPEKLLDMLTEKEEIARQIIPQLKTMQKFELEKENILKFRGYAGVKTVLNDVLRSCDSGEEYLMFGSEGQLSKRMPEFSRIYVAKKDQKKLKARILLRQANGEKVLSKYTAMKSVPTDVVSLTSVSVYKNKVSLLLWSETPEAIIIDHEDTAKTFRSYFEFMWKKAK